jgi:hypothetical protein
MRPDGVVMPAPALDGDLRLAKSVEDLAVEQLVPEPSIEALDVTILPRAARSGSAFANDAESRAKQSWCFGSPHLLGAARAGSVERDLSARLPTKKRAAEAAQWRSAELKGTRPARDSISICVAPSPPSYGLVREG